MGTDHLYPKQQFRVFIGVHPGLALMGVKGPGLWLFVRKGDQAQTLQLSQVSQICPVLHEDDHEPALCFGGGGPQARLFPYKQDIVSAPEIAVWQRSLPSERKHQQWRNQVSAYKGSNILVMGTLHADLGNDLGLVGVS